MNKKLFVIGVLLGVSLGVAGGLKLGRLWFEVGQTFGDLSAISTSEEFAFLQYRNASRPAARDALNESARLIEEVNAIRPERSHNVDLGFTYTRLALVEESDGNIAQSKADFLKAQQSFHKTQGLKGDYSERNLRDVISRIDKSADPPIKP